MPICWAFCETLDILEDSLDFLLLIISLLSLPIIFSFHSASSFPIFFHQTIKSIVSSGACELKTLTSNLHNNNLLHSSHTMLFDRDLDLNLLQSH